MSNKIFEIEEYLQDQKVFVSGIDGRVTHSDSYNTVIDFNALELAYKNNTFTKENWVEAVDYWSKKGYLSPCLKLLSLTINRKLNLEISN